jgi:hypothetical protein
MIVGLLNGCVFLTNLVDGEGKTNKLFFMFFKFASLLPFYCGGGQQSAAVGGRLVLSYLFWLRASATATATCFQSNHVSYQVKCLYAFSRRCGASCQSLF